MPRVLHDPNFTFRDDAQLSGTVDLQVFRRWDDIVVVVVSELIDADGRAVNGGISASNGIAAIATAVFTQLGYDFEYLIEYYPEHGVQLDLARSNTKKREMPEQFHLVTLTWDDEARRYQVDPMADAWAWKHISRADAEKIIGEPFQLGPSAASGAV